MVGESGCLGCHVIGQNGNNGPGPPLTHVGSQLSAVTISAVIRHPTAPMPSFQGLLTTSPQKFRAMLEFLEDLK